MESFLWKGVRAIFAPRCTWIANGESSGYSGGVFNGGAIYMPEPCTDEVVYPAVAYDASSGPPVSWPPPWPTVAGAPYFTEEVGYALLWDAVIIAGPPLQWSAARLIVEFPLVGGGGSEEVPATLPNGMPSGSSDWLDSQNRPVF